MPSLPSINLSSLIRPLTRPQNEQPLKLRICQGMREFQVTLSLADNENGARISMRHLAEAVLYETGLLPREQRYCFRGISWVNPDLGPWSPGLRDLGLRNGDKVLLVAFHTHVPDWESVDAQRVLESRNKKLTREVHDIFYKLHGIHQGYVDSGNQVLALAEIRRTADLLKDKLMVLIKDLNALHLDHRNYDGLARRRETVDNAQRQVDKCVEVATNVFHKLAQSQQLADNGSLYSCDPLHATQKQRRNPKRTN